ncbi:MAG: ABC transporter substrate-binding protein, partial [Anaerolineae bacterium]
MAQLCPAQPFWLPVVVAVLALTASCAMPGDAAPVVKIGLIAPFEGLGRPLGYGLLAEVKAAITNANASAALGRYRVALVALNDDLDPPTAVRQAQALAQDGDVVAVLGPFDQATAAAAAPILQAAGIPTLVGAPLAQELAGVRSLCPSAAEIAQVLTVAAGQSPALVHFPGDAASAADALLRRREAGWRGVMLVGPDAVRPWYIQRAGPAAEGTRAVVCDVAGAAAADEVLPVVALARAGAVRLLDVLSEAAAEGRLSRASVHAALASYGPHKGLAPGVRWYQV